MSTSTIRISHPLAAGAEVRKAEVWDFPEGLIGLPRHRRFALLPLPEAPPFRLLASLDDPAFGLVVVEPSVIVPGYTLALGREDLAPLAKRDAGRLLVLVPVVLPDGDVPLTLNLRGPLVLSPEERRGVQRVSPDEGHALRWTPSTADQEAPGCSS